MQLRYREHGQPGLCHTRHNYDCIIFRNETVNLVSHECHFYLHVIMTNGIPPCKALVMAGENATNDVDEEVYGNDGAER